MLFGTAFAADGCSFCDSASVSARFVVPALCQQVTGALSFCLYSSANGIAEFEVRLRDSGGLLRGGQDEQGPALFVIKVFPLNQEPSFRLHSSCVSRKSGKSLAVIGHLSYLHCGNHLLAWRRSFAYQTPYTIANFTRNMVLGERSADGSDIEASQSFTFTVIPSPSAAHLFSSMPVLHANGTLEWALLVNRTGQANLTILMHDDGFSQDLAAGTLHYAAAHALSYAGVNVSAPAHVSVVVAATYAVIRFNMTDSNLTMDCSNLAACGTLKRQACVVSSGAGDSPDARLNYTQCVENLIFEAAREVIAIAEGLPLARILSMNDSLSFQMAAVDSEQALLFTSRAHVYAQRLEAATGVQSIEVLQSEAYVKNWDHTASRFTMTETTITILGFDHPEDAPFELPNMVRDIVSPRDSPLDDQGRERVFFDVKPLRWRKREGDPWQEANSTHDPVILSSVSIDVWCRANCLDSRTCCNGTFVAVKPPGGFGDVDYQIRIKGSDFSEILRVHVVFSMMTLVEFTERWPGDQKETVHDFIQSSLDFRVSDPDSRGRPPLIEYDTFVQEAYTVTTAGSVSSTLKQCVTNEHDFDAYLLVHPIPQSHPSPVQGTPRIELRKQGNSVFGELFVNMKPFAVGNASFSVTFVMPREPYNQTNGIFMIVVSALNQPPRFTMPRLNLTVLEDEFSVEDYVDADSAVDIGPGPENTPDEEGQSVEFSVSSQSTDWSRVFSYGPVLYSNGSLIFRTNANAFGTVLFVAVLTDNGDPPASTAQSFNISVLSVNSAPSFHLQTESLELWEDSLRFDWPFFATNISTGEMSGEELSQQLTFVLVQTSPLEDSALLFAQRPTLSSNGTLSLVLNPNAYSHKSIGFSITLIDDGNCDNNGQNKSAAQMFVIHVLAVNDAPSHNSSRALKPLTCSHDFTYLNASINCSATAGSNQCDSEAFRRCVVKAGSLDFSNFSACINSLKPRFWGPVILHTAGSHESDPLQTAPAHNEDSPQLGLDLTGSYYVLLFLLVALVRSFSVLLHFLFDCSFCAFG